MAVDSFEGRFGGILYWKLKGVVAEFSWAIEKACREARIKASMSEQRRLLEDVFDYACELVKEDIRLNRLSIEKEE